MPNRDVAKLFNNGQSQAVRLPKEFRFKGSHVRIRRLGTGVLLEPATMDVDSFFAAIDAAAPGEFIPEGIGEPPPLKDIRFD